MTAPWLARKDWAEHRIRDDRYTKAGCMVKGGILLTTIVGTIVVTSITRGADAGLLIFPAFCLLFLGFALYARAHHEKFGTPVFEVEGVPIAPGRMLAGYVRTTAALAPEGGFKVRVRCVRKRETGSGKNKRTNTIVLWQEDTEMPGALKREDGIAIPVAFQLPPDAPGTDTRNARDKVLWELDVTAALPGVDFSAHFELPVFDRGEVRDG